MWIYDSVSEELVNINEHIHSIYVTDRKYDSGMEYKIHFKNIIRCNGFSILYNSKLERDNYYEHIKSNLSVVKVDSSNPPITL